MSEESEVRDVTAALTTLMGPDRLAATQQGGVFLMLMLTAVTNRTLNGMMDDVVEVQMDRAFLLLVAHNYLMQLVTEQSVNKELEARIQVLEAARPADPEGLQPSPDVEPEEDEEEAHGL